jgi:hypothetical protein
MSPQQAKVAFTNWKSWRNCQLWSLSWRATNAKSGLGHALVSHGETISISAIEVREKGSTMSEIYDFEQAWLSKLSGCLAKTAGEDIRREVMAGSEELTMESSRSEVIAWTQAAMERLESLLHEDQLIEVMTGCACQFPESSLREAKEEYAETGDVDLVHRMLQDQFESFLSDTLELAQALIEEVIARGWGLAGIRQGDTIIATKIPKSGNLVAYLQEMDPAKKRQYYCHCPRIRDALKTGDAIASTYCYCGAGYYKGLWEEILGQPVSVKVLQSVLKGDEVCRIAIRLP